MAAPAPLREWSSEGYLGLPSDRLHLAYTLFCAGLWPLAYWGAVLNRGELTLTLTLTLTSCPSEGLSWRTE